MERITDTLSVTRLFRIVGENKDKILPTFLFAELTFDPTGTQLSQLHLLLVEHDIELSLITLQWFLTAFASVLNTRCLLRIWDLFFFHGSLVLFQVPTRKVHGTDVFRSLPE